MPLEELGAPEAVPAWLWEERLLAPYETVLLAVSGGVDSMTLLHLFRFLMPIPVRPVCLHVDHRLRGAAAVEDARFVRAVAEAWGVPCFVYALPFPPAGGNVQGTARALRYDLFAHAAREARASAVLTAHNLDDVVETFFLRLFRGAGPRGLGGIPVVRPLFDRRLLRPLLPVRRRSIEAYADRHGVPWREDASNRSLAYVRNRLRHLLLPLVEELAPSAARHVVRLTNVLGEDEAFLEEAARKFLRRRLLAFPSTLLVCWTALAGLPLPVLRRAVRLAWAELRCGRASLTYEDVQASLEVVLGKRRAVSLPGGVTVERQGGYVLWVCEGERRAYASAVNWPGTVRIPSFGCSVRVRHLSESAGAADEDEEDEKEVACRATLSLSPDLPFIFRSRRPGDRLETPWGPREVRELLRLAGVPPRLREAWPVGEQGGRIVWVPGVSSMPTGGVPGEKVVVDVGWCTSPFVRRFWRHFCKRRKGR
ncbi:MAG: tRNA lysidine(34) synthetase TilS [Brockia lithotrophica]|nr:tRNA lysidine(34) synthetase TilS [Brockia lithotrophica]